MRSLLLFLAICLTVKLCPACSDNFIQLLPTRLVIIGLVIILIWADACDVLAIGDRL
ncbi:MAG: hypothetical protein RMY34_06175 [Aulosira sp. DedQUE10]|nr:hypothetical protein [Aulosira sp. DedQUE10]